MDTNTLSTDQKTVKKNFILHSLDGIFFFIGMFFAEQRTIIPAFVANLTDSAFLIGLIPSITMLGWFLPQIFSAYFTESKSVKKPLVIQVGIGQRLPWLLIFIGVLLFGKSHPSLTLFIFFFGLATAAISGGINSPIWLSFLANTVPVKLRGRLFSIRSFFGALIGIAVGFIVKKILVYYAFPLNYNICILMYFVFTSISLIFVVLIKEMPSPTVKKSDSIRDYFKKIPQLLKNNKNFSRYMLSRVLLSFLAIPSAFITAYAITKLGAVSKDVATFMLLTVISQSVVSMAFGYLADKSGHIIVLRIGFFASITAAIITFLAHSVSQLYPAFILQGFFTATVLISGPGIILEFCPPAERPTYIGVSNMALFPFTTFLPMIAGLILQYKLISYPVMFLIAAIVASAGWIMLTFVAREPRLVNSPAVQ